LFGHARDTHRRLVLLGAGALLALSVALGAVSPALAGDAPPEFRVITHPARHETSVTRQFLADAFLRNVTHWSDDEPIRPVDQRADAGVRHRFSDSVLRRSVQAVKTYWQQRIFSGRGVPPPELDSDEAVVDYVEAHPGALGYISGTAAPGKAKVLAVGP
jgi:ABC-type phosphate transport system substrate-binding protein